MTLAAAWILAALVAGSVVYCLLVLEAARRYKTDASRRYKTDAARRDKADAAGRDKADDIGPDRRAGSSPSGAALPPVSVLKPLAGAEEDLEENLASFFTLDYPDYEIVCAVRHAGDAAGEVLDRVAARFPAVPCRLIVTGEPPYPNAKVYALEKMLEAARHELVAMCDSDIRVGADFLSVLAAEFQDPALGLTTCPYRAVAGRSLWSRLEAVGMNTEFLGGILVARMLEGMKFAVGPTIVARRRVIEAIGGMRRVSEYLAEDFVLGRLAAEAGFGVGLSSYVVEHRIGGQPFMANMAHRLRWARSTRRSRPVGYAGQLFTNPLPLALALAAVGPGWWPLAAAALLARMAAAWATAVWVLGGRLLWRGWWLLPWQDLLSFLFWTAGFFGNTIRWRGVVYCLYADGKFQRIR